MVMSKKFSLFLLFIIILLGVALRGYHITARSLWFDEAFSWRLIHFPLGEMITRDASDVHPPLYYILLKGWAVVFGSSLLSLRSFSVAASALAVAAMYGFSASAWRSRTAGVIAALLLAVSGWQIAYAWEARMYTLGTAFALISAWLLLKALRQKQQRPWWWIVYGLSVAAFLYIHYYAIFSVAAQVLFILGTIVSSARFRIGEMLQHKMTWYAALAGVMIATAFAPWLPTFLQQQSQVQASFWIPKIGGWAVPDTFYRMIAPTSGIPAHHGYVMILTVLPIIAVLVGSIWLVVSCFRSIGFPKAKPFMHTCDAAWLTVMSALLPFVFSISLSLISQSLYQDRYFVFANLFLIAGFAGIISRFKSRAVVATITFISAALLLILFIVYWKELNILNKPGSHGATQYVFAHRAEGENVYSSSPFVFFAVLHYAQEEFQNPTTPKLYSESGQLSHFSGGPILTAADVVGPSIFTGSDAKSFWMVDTTGFGSTELEVPPTFQKVDRKVFSEIFGYQGDVIVNHYVKK